VPSVLTPEQLEARLAEIPAWAVVDGTLTRSFTFADFSAAFGFMTRVALVAEQLDHHPDWSNSWNRVDIAIASHDAGGITDRCVTFAARVDALIAAG
jgi:4a-hydroxytetrahydrobiopterin dehydratase